MDIGGPGFVRLVLALTRQELEVPAYVVFISLNGVRGKALLGGEPGREVLELSFQMA